MNLNHVYVPAQNMKDVYDEAQVVVAADGQYHVRVVVKNGSEWVETQFMDRECLPGCALGSDGESNLVNLPLC